MTCIIVEELLALKVEYLQECQDEIFYFEKMEVNDFRNDVLLAEACRTDVDKHCKTVQPGGCLSSPQTLYRSHIITPTRSRAFNGE